MNDPSFFWRFKWFLVFFAMFLIDFSPVPFTAAIVLYIFLFRPLWFKKFIEHLYSGK